MQPTGGLDENSHTHMHVGPLGGVAEKSHFCKRMQQNKWNAKPNITIELGIEVDTTES